jgi:hypothetical protein
MNRGWGWDTHWDSTNSFNISNTVIGVGLGLEPKVELPKKPKQLIRIITMKLKESIQKKSILKYSLLLIDK